VMLFGDAKDSIDKLIADVKNLWWRSSRRTCCCTRRMPKRCEPCCATSSSGSTSRIIQAGSYSHCRSRSSASIHPTARHSTRSAWCATTSSGRWPSSARRGSSSAASRRRRASASRRRCCYPAASKSPLRVPAPDAARSL